MNSIKYLTEKLYKMLYSKRNILFISFCCFLLVAFFRGFLDYGLEFDKVFRINNVIPFINHKAYPYDQSIFSISLFGAKIPLMYKNYISSITIIPYFPLYFFDNYYFGLKFLDFFYFIVTIVVTFKIVYKYTNFAYLFSLLLIISPILYPEILFGFTSNLHVLFLVGGGHLLYQYYTRVKPNRWLLFGGTFLLFFSCNFTFYNTWIVVAIFIIILLFFRRQLIKSLFDVNDFFIIALSFLLGLFNFIVYNFANGFPSVTPLFLKIFHPEIYNQQPIDYKPSQPIIEDVILKLRNIIPTIFGDKYFDLIVISFLIILVLYIYVFFIIIRKKTLNKYKYYFIPIIGCFLVFLLILISPNTTRAEHYSRLSPFIEFSVVAIVLLYNKVFNFNWTKYVILLLLCGYIGINIFVSYEKVRKAYFAKGTRFFSPAIFDLNNYLNANSIDYHSVFFMEWGIYSQLYFLNKGEVKINSYVFELMDKNDSKLSQKMESIFIDILKAKNVKSNIYFPLYCNEFPDILKTFNEVGNKFGCKIDEQKVFYERNGGEVLSLYRVSDIDMNKFDWKEFFKNKFNKEIVSSDISSFIDYSKTGYDLIDGVYSIEKGYCWYSQNARILLNSKNKSEFIIDYYIPDLNKYSSIPVLSIYFDGDIVFREQIKKSGKYTRKINVDKKYNSELLIVNIQMSSCLVSKSDRRNLGVVIGQIGFK